MQSGKKTEGFSANFNSYLSSNCQVEQFVSWVIIKIFSQNNDSFLWGSGFDAEFPLLISIDDRVGHFAKNDKKCQLQNISIIKGPKGITNASLKDPQCI